MTADASAQGRKNNRAGKAAMRRALGWVRANGAPHADAVRRPHSSDLTGVGDMAIEVTVEGWEHIGIKADQAAADASSRGLDMWCVWKPRRGKGDMGEAWCVTTFGQWWALHAELAELRTQVRVLRDAIGPRAEAS